MKTAIKKTVNLFLVITFAILIYGCSEDSSDTLEMFNNQDDIVNLDDNATILLEDSEALLFMLEEEKLARDTYEYLDKTWGLNQFANIKKSEQTHIDAIENLLKQHKISYTILPEGIFSNQELQNHYDSFVIDGAKSAVEALKIGATIEDLDIKDLESYVSLTENNTLINVYQNLICGSRNHLRSFIKGLDKKGGTYTPQFITQDAFDAIINGSNEQCN
ncbi:DUF2202 domain-containing protein [uncultured Polaribacter sp.]|uniref:DUF2202 domain-containing protein n=1 Tax=uncultured Polaribacter sp. TaxID=174711 RepID=UPI002625DA29|nr:DUF2202 domain-containing protein [uncultured Polaribacter sp.]